MSEPGSGPSSVRGRIDAATGPSTGLGSGLDLLALARFMASQPDQDAARAAATDWDRPGDLRPVARPPRGGGAVADRSEHQGSETANDFGGAERADHDPVATQPLLSVAGSCTEGAFVSAAQVSAMIAAVAGAPGSMALPQGTILTSFRGDPAGFDAWLASRLPSAFALPSGSGQGGRSDRSLQAGATGSVAADTGARTVARQASFDDRADEVVEVEDSANFNVPSRSDRNSSASIEVGNDEPVVESAAPPCLQSPSAAFTSSLSFGHGRHGNSDSAAVAGTPSTTPRGAVAPDTRVGALRGLERSGLETAAEGHENLRPLSAIKVAKADPSPLGIESSSDARAWQDLTLETTSTLADTHSSDRSTSLAVSDQEGVVTPHEQGPASVIPQAVTPSVTPDVQPSDPQQPIDLMPLDIVPVTTSPPANATPLPSLNPEVPSTAPSSVVTPEPSAGQPPVSPVEAAPLLPSYVQPPVDTPLGLNAGDTSSTPSVAGTLASIEPTASSASNPGSAATHGSATQIAQLASPIAADAAQPSLVGEEIDAGALTSTSNGGAGTKTNNGLDFDPIGWDPARWTSGLSASNFQYGHSDLLGPPSELAPLLLDVLHRTDFLPTILTAEPVLAAVDGFEDIHAPPTLVSDKSPVATALTATTSLNLDDASYSNLFNDPQSIVPHA